MSKEEWAKLAENLRKMEEAFERKQKDLPDYAPYANARYTMMGLAGVAEAMAAE